MSGRGFPALVCLLMMLMTEHTYGGTILDGNKGTYFVLGFLENFFHMNSTQLIIATDSVVLVKVDVDAPLLGWSDTVFIYQGSSATIDLPPTVQGHLIELASKGVRVQATAPVSVFGNSKANDGADMYLGIPVDMLGVNYYAVTYHVFPEILVVAAYDDTYVCITLPVGLTHVIHYGGFNYSGGESICFTLQQFETFHLLIPLLDDDPNFTGAHIKSTKPVAVFSGSKCSTVDGIDFDHLTEMLLPVNLLGTRYCTTHTPDADREDVFIVVATESDTNVIFGAGPVVNLANAGDYFEEELVLTAFVTVTSNKPILVAMFSKSNAYNSFLGQPSFTLLIPEKLYANRYEWGTPTDVIDEKPLMNYLTVIIEESLKGGLILDELVAIWPHENVVTGTSKVNLWQSISDGTHCLYHTDPAVTFFAMLHGVGTSYDMSYLCPAGFAQVLYCCNITGDPHLTRFDGWRASLPLSCAYKVTQLRLTNSICEPGSTFYEEIEVVVFAGNSKDTINGRVYVSDVSVEVTFKTGIILGPSNTYQTGESLIPDWKLSDNMETMQGRVLYGYDNIEKKAWLWITGTYFYVEFRPVNRNGRPGKYGLPGLWIKVGSAELIYDSTIRFPSTLCSTVDDNHSDVMIPGVSKKILGIYGLLRTSADNLPYGEQDANCSCLVNELGECHPLVAFYAFKCFDLALSLDVLQCAESATFSVSDVICDCLRHFCSASQCAILAPYIVECPQIALVVPELDC